MKDGQLAMQLENNALVITDIIEEIEREENTPRVPSWDEIEEGHALLVNYLDSNGWGVYMVEEKFDNFIGIINGKGTRKLMVRGTEGGNTEKDFEYKVAWYMEGGKLVKCERRRTKWYSRRKEIKRVKV